MLAKHPPLSTSVTMITGASTFFASNMFAMSYFEMLISAGEPAPSITTISFSFLRLSRASMTIGKPFCKVNVS